MVVRQASTLHHVMRCYPVMAQLRPHLSPHAYRDRVGRQRKEGYRLAFVEHKGQVVAVAGFRLMSTLHRGRVLYVDDLVTDSSHRSRGHGAALMGWLRRHARQQKCDALELESGVHRFDAHRFYFTQRMTIASYHFTQPLKPGAYGRSTSIETALPPPRQSVAMPESLPRRRSA